jgi:serine O-acetyltransferase
LQDWHRYSDGPRRAKLVLARLTLDAGFATVFLFRLAARLQRRGKRLRSRLVHRLNMIVSACELSPSAKVGPGLMLPHPYGVTIGDGCEVGAEVTLYQGVVLGAAAAARYPRIGRGVVIYPHAIVYGGIEVGADAVILGNSVANRDLAPGGTYGGTPAAPVGGRAPGADAAADADAAD